MAYRSFCAIGAVDASTVWVINFFCTRLSVVLAIVFFFAPGIVELQAQEISFTPRYDARSIEDEDEQDVRVQTQPTKISHPRKTSYSFAQLGSVFKDLCEALRRDKRDVRVYEVSAKGLKEDLQCSACRALYRQFQQACRPKAEPVKTARKSTPLIATPTPTEISSPESEGESNQAESPADENDSAPEAQDEEAVPNPQGDESSEDASAESSDAEEQAATPTPTCTPTATATPTPQPARYPNTELIDASSRVSTALYEMDPEFGDILKAVQNFSQRLIGAQGITKAESDYYGILSAYLVSAWEGRPGSPLDPKVQAKQDVSELFQ